MLATQTDAAKGNAIKGFLNYIYADGQKLASSVDYETVEEPAEAGEGANVEDRRSGGLIEDLRTRIREQQEQVPDDVVVLVGHSQGSVLAAWTVAGRSEGVEDPPTPETIYLVTCGVTAALAVWHFLHEHVLPGVLPAGVDARGRVAQRLARHRSHCH